jgi:hypothetical protein
MPVTAEPGMFLSGSTRLKEFPKAGAVMISLDRGAPRLTTTSIRASWT